MKEVTLYSLGNPGTFDLILGDPMYWTERLSYELSRNLYLMSDAGMTLQENENSDLESAEDTVDMFITSLQSWLGGLEEGGEGSRAEFPSIPEILTLISSGTGGVALLIAKVAVYFLCRQFEKYFTSNKAEGQADNAELIALLKQALIKVRDDESEVSQLELLAQIPIKVSVESVGNFEDLTLSPTLA